LVKWVNEVSKVGKVNKVKRKPGSESVFYFIMQFEWGNIFVDRL